MLVKRREPDEPRSEDRKADPAVPPDQPGRPSGQTLIGSEGGGQSPEVAVVVTSKVDPPEQAPSFAGGPARELVMKTGEKACSHSPKIGYSDVSTSPCRDNSDDKAEDKKEDSVQDLEGTIKSRVEQRLRKSLARAAASSSSTPEMSSFTSSLRNRRAMSLLSPNRIGADFGRKRRSGVFASSPKLDISKESRPLSAASPAYCSIKERVSLSVQSPATTDQVAKRARLERIFRS